MSLSDAEIVQAVLAGDKQLFGELISRYWGMVYQLAYQRLNEPMLAEDRSQEAFLQAFLSLEHLQNPKQFRAWLYGITLNLCKNFLRKQGYWDKLGNFDETVAEEDSTLENLEIRAVLDTAIAQLSEAKQEALILYYYEGFSLSEIADLLQISPNAVKARLHQARQALKAQLVKLFPTQIKAKGAKTMIPVQVVDTPQQIQDKHRFSQVLLFNEESRRALVIWIWEEEAVLAIAQLLAAYTPQRPRQHDFAAKIIEATSASLEFVLLDYLAEGIPYASLSLKTATGSTNIESRPGEAIALALRLKAPIYVSERSWENASKPLPADKKPNRHGIQSIVGSLETMSQNRIALAKREDWVNKRLESNKAIREQAREIIDASFS